MLKLEKLETGGMLLTYQTVDDSQRAVGTPSTFLSHDIEGLLQKVVMAHQDCVLALERTKRKLRTAVQGKIDAEKRIAALELLIKQSTSK